MSTPPGSPPPPSQQSPNILDSGSDVEDINEDSHFNATQNYQYDHSDESAQDNNLVSDATEQVTANIDSRDTVSNEATNDDSNSFIVAIANNVEVADDSVIIVNDNAVSDVVNEDNSNPMSIDEESNSSTSRASSNLPEAVIRKADRSPDEPPAKVRKLNESLVKDDNDAETCPICLESWGNSGDHRLVSLKCGHLFGAKCVERWLKAQNSKDRSCPTCKSRATFKDVRPIYARKLVASDTSEITALQKQVENLQSEKVKLELELQKNKIAHRACVQELENIRTALAKKMPREPYKGWHFSLEKNLEIFRDGGCRVMSYNCRTYELYVSQKTVNNLFPGFGYRRINCIDFKLGSFVHLHPKQIRDMAYSQPKDLLITASLDGTSRVIERGVPSLTIQCGTPLWSCAWDVVKTEQLYLGGVGGVVLQYDIRNTSTHLKRLSIQSDVSPTISLCPTEFGLVTCQLNSSWLWSPNNIGEWHPMQLPIDGPFTSMCYDPTSTRLAVASRPNGLERSKLTVCKLKTGSEGDTNCLNEETFSISTRASIMSRSTFVRLPNALWIASHSESDATLYLHGLERTRSMSLPSATPILDMTAVPLNSDLLLAALSDSRLKVYKAVETRT